VKILLSNTRSRFQEFHVVEKAMIILATLRLAIEGNSSALCEVWDGSMVKIGWL